jgi:hypothetical protein
LTSSKTKERKTNHAIHTHLQPHTGQATTRGTTEIAKFETKIEALKNILPGNFNNYITGNKADKLAGQGTKKPLA